ncbi:MAG: ribosome maturation factor RimM [Clostridiales bacterium]
MEENYSQKELPLKPTNSKPRIMIGKIATPHGIKGYLKVISTSDYPHRFLPGNQMYLQDTNTVLTIEALQNSHNGLLIKFVGIDSRDQAQLLKGNALEIDKDQAGILPEGHFYYWQLIGLSVYEKTEKLGIIKDVLPNSANDIYVVEKTAGGDLLLPALKSIIKKIDLENQMMEVILPPGLLDI